MKALERYVFMINKPENEAMNARQPARSRRMSKACPAHPVYNDNLSESQIEAIRKLADPEGKRAAKRVLLYPSVV